MEKSTFTPAYEALTARLVALREAAGLTQRDLARRLRREHNFVARVEMGNRRLDPVEFILYCDALRVAPDKVFGDVLRGVRALKKPRS